MSAPAGAPTSENVSVCGGRSPSLAAAVNVYAASAGMVAVAGTPGRAGATVASGTVSVTAASVSAVPSETRTVSGYLPGPWASVGVQLNAPLVASIDAPGGGVPASENVNVCAGTSGSVAVAVNV